MERFKSLKDHVYDFIAEEILIGNLHPEEKINENSICKELNISRTPVREALIQLSSEGILKNEPRKGFMVKSMGEKEAAELYVIIGTLDGLAAKLSCDSLDSRDLKDMQFYIDSMDLAIKSKNYEMYLKQQKDFHKIYLDKCGNDALIDQMEHLKNKFIKRSYIDDKEGKTNAALLATNDEHRKILQYFINHEGDEAKEYLSAVHWAPENAHFDLMSLNKK